MQVLSRPKVTGGIAPHLGLEIAPNVVMHNTPGSGKHLGTRAEFGAGLPVREEVVLVPFERGVEIVQRATMGLERPYDLLTFDCKSAVSEALGADTSSTIGGLLKLAAFIAGAIAIGKALAS